jgi:hypothetical protein
MCVATRSDQAAAGAPSFQLLSSDARWPHSEPRCLPLSFPFPGPLHRCPSKCRVRTYSLYPLTHVHALHTLQKVASYTAEEVIRALTAMLPQLSPAAFPPHDTPTPTPTPTRSPSYPRHTPAHFHAHAHPHTPTPPPGRAQVAPPPHPRTPAPQTPQPHRTPLPAPTFPDHMQYQPLLHSNTRAPSAGPNAPQAPPPLGERGDQEHTYDASVESETKILGTRLQPSRPTAGSGLPLDESMMAALSSSGLDACWVLGAQQPGQQRERNGECPAEGATLIRAHPALSAAFRSQHASGSAQQHWHHPHTSSPPLSAAPPQLQPPQDVTGRANMPHGHLAYSYSAASDVGEEASWQRSAAGFAAAQAELQDARVRAWKDAGLDGRRAPGGRSHGRGEAVFADGAQSEGDWSSTWQDSVGARWSSSQIGCQIAPGMGDAGALAVPYTPLRKVAPSGAGNGRRSPSPLVSSLAVPCHLSPSPAPPPHPTIFAVAPSLRCTSLAPQSFQQLSLRRMRFRSLGLCPR